MDKLNPHNGGNRIEDESQEKVRSTRGERRSARLVRSQDGLVYLAIDRSESGLELYVARRVRAPGTAKSAAGNANREECTFFLWNWSKRWEDRDERITMGTEHVEHNAVWKHFIWNVLGISATLHDARAFVALLIQADSERAQRKLTDAGEVSVLMGDLPKALSEDLSSLRSEDIHEAATLWALGERFWCKIFA